MLLFCLKNSYSENSFAVLHMVLSWLGSRIEKIEITMLQVYPEKKNRERTSEDASANPKNTTQSRAHIQLNKKMHNFMHSITFPETLQTDHTNRLLNSFRKITRRDLNYLPSFCQWTSACLQ